MSDLPVIPVEDDANLKLLVDTGESSRPKEEDMVQPDEAKPPPPIPEGDA